MLGQPAQLAADDHIFLIGRPPVGEFLGFMRTMAQDGHSFDQAQLIQEWRRANDRVSELEQAEAGLADNPPIGAIPESLDLLSNQVSANPIFQRSFQMFPTRLALVELDRLVVFQKHINLRFVDQLASILGVSPSDEAVLRLALSIDRYDPNVSLSQTAPNAFTFISPSNDFRFLDATLLDPGQVLGYIANGPATAFLGLAIGYGSNYLNAFHMESRLILNNGSHRAYALRRLGIHHAPCVVQEVSRRDELELMGQTDVQQNPDRYLKAPRPPLLKDYFDPLLTKTVSVQRKNRLVKLSFGVEQTDIPAT